MPDQISPPTTTKETNTPSPTVSAPTPTPQPAKSPAPTPTPQPAKTPTPTPQQKTKKTFTIENKNLIESILYLKQNNLIQESKSTIKFESTKEAENSKKEDVIYAIREKLNTAKQDITELQKAGNNLHLETIKLIAIPLKEKIWLATMTKKDLENIFRILNEVNTIVLPLKKENDAKVAEKERLEKIENQKEQAKVKEAAQKTPTPIKPSPIAAKPPKPKTQPTNLPIKRITTPKAQQSLKEPST